VAGGIVLKLFKRMLAPAAAEFDRRVDQRLVHYARREEVSELSDGLAKVYGDLLEATVDLRRWLADDLDAAQETAALLGRTLNRLSIAVEELGEELARLAERTERIESAVVERSAAAPPQD
jgi:hypothetical protein